MSNRKTQRYESYSLIMGRRKGTDDRTGVSDHVDEDQESDTEVIIQAQTDPHSQLNTVHVEEHQRFYDAAQSSVEVDRKREEDRPIESTEETRQRQFQVYMQSTLDLITKTMGTMPGASYGHHELCSNGRTKLKHQQQSSSCPTRTKVQKPPTFTSRRYART